MEGTTFTILLAEAKTPWRDQLINAIQEEGHHVICVESHEALLQNWNEQYSIIDSIILGDEFSRDLQLVTILESISRAPFENKHTSYRPKLIITTAKNKSLSVVKRAVPFGVRGYLFRDDTLAQTIANLSKVLFAGRRSSERISTKLAVRLRINHTELKGTLVDLSLRGAQIVLAKHQQIDDLRVGAPFFLVLRSPVSQEIISIHSIVRRLRWRKIIFRERLSAGVEFDHPDTNMKLKLQKIFDYSSELNYMPQAIFSTFNILIADKSSPWLDRLTQSIEKEGHKSIVVNNYTDIIATLSRPSFQPPSNEGIDVIIFSDELLDPTGMMRFFHEELNAKIETSLRENNVSYKLIILSSICHEQNYYNSFDSLNLHGWVYREDSLKQTISNIYRTLFTSRRLQPRATTKIKAKVIIRDKLYYGTMVDLSLSGAQIIFNSLQTIVGLEKELPIDISFNSALFSEKLVCHASIRRITYKKTLIFNKTGIGVEFINIDERLKKIIASVVEYANELSKAKQLNLKYHGHNRNIY